MKHIHFAAVDIESVKESENTFLLSTLHGTAFLLIDAPSADTLRHGLTPGLLSDLGIGNAFFISRNGRTLLCTQTLVAQGLEDYMVTIGDIAFIDYDAIHKRGISTLKRKSFPVSLIANDNDSIFISGYTINQKDEIHSVTIRGIGKKLSKEDIEKEFGSIEVIGGEYPQNQSIILQLKNNLHLEGLSGSPVLNKNGEAVGIYSGRNLMIENKTDSTWFIRVSLFEE